jgi:hypothetical protein
MWELSSNPAVRAHRIGTDARVKGEEPGAGRAMRWWLVTAAFGTSMCRIANGLLGSTRLMGRRTCAFVFRKDRPRSPLQRAKVSCGSSTMTGR